MDGNRTQLFAFLASAFCTLVLQIIAVSDKWPRVPMILALPTTWLTKSMPQHTSSAIVCQSHLDIDAACAGLASWLQEGIYPTGFDCASRWIQGVGPEGRLPLTLQAADGDAKQPVFEELHFRPITNVPGSRLVMSPMLSLGMERLVEQVGKDITEPLHVSLIDFREKQVKYGPQAWSLHVA